MAPVSPHTPITFSQGQVLPGNADELQSMANEAARKGEVDKAMHLYTMAIDLLTKGMALDANGRASEADLVALNKTSDGQLAKLLSNRSLMYLKQQDVDAAVEDAVTCTQADPQFEKGHMRLVVALEVANVPLEQQLDACEQGLFACPDSELLVKSKWRLKKKIASQADACKEVGNSQNDLKLDRGNFSREELQRMADDPRDPRHITAAADLGSILAVGAYGLGKDVQAAERYLRVASDHDDVVAQRHLGLLLLQNGRPAEAAEELGKAASAGDEEAAETLQRLVAEAREQESIARQKLLDLADEGDPRALEMLKEFPGGA